MDHELGWQIECRSCAGCARGTANAGRLFRKLAASLQELAASGAMYRPINTASAKQSLVGCVDNGIDGNTRDIALQNFDFGNGTTSITRETRTKALDDRDR